MEAFARNATGAGAGPRTNDRPTERPPSPPPLPRELAQGKSAQPPGTPGVLRPVRSLSPNSIEDALLGAIEGPAAPVITERAIDDPLAEMRQLLSAADYTGALELADLILSDDPGNADALECQQKCQALLELESGFA